MGVIVSRGRMQHANGDEPYQLTIRAKHLIDAIRGRYEAIPLREVNPPPTPTPNSTVK